MGKEMLLLSAIFGLSFLIVTMPLACGWGYDGHFIICRIAQARLSKTAAEAVRKLLPPSANDDLGPLCPWPDRIKFRYPWTSDLHFINTPDNLCTYKYTRDCKSRSGAKDRCLEGAINNYTSQLLRYRDRNPPYNLTESLLFLSHFVGDIHQPLHVGFTSDRGGNTIKVIWFNRTQVLHHVWDTEIIRKAIISGGIHSNTYDYIIKIQQKINGEWRKQVNKWGSTCYFKKICPNMYAGESIKAACEWAYKGVRSGSILKEDYFETRLPVVEMRLAQAGIRLAATLNRIFKR